MIRKCTFIAMASLAVVLAVGLLPPTSRARAAGALDFTLRDLQGHEVTLSQYRGHPVVVDFWATWCAPCRHQIPELKKLYTKYHKSKGLEVLGISCDTVQGEGIKVVRPFVREFDINYPILLAEPPVLDDFRVQALPTTLFLAPDGSIAGRMLGSGGVGELAEGVNSLLAGKSKSAKKLTPDEQKKENRYDIEYRQ